MPRARTVLLIAIGLHLSVTLAQTPADERDIEDSIEQEIEAEDDGSPAGSSATSSTMEEEIEAEIDAEADGSGPVAEDPQPTPAADPTPPAVAQPGRQRSVPSGRSEPIFDWDKYRNQSQVPHPFADKGLFRINKRGEYFYRVEPSEQKHAASFRFGIFDPVNLENPDQAGQLGSTFEENYEQTGTPMIMVDYERQLWRLPVGKLGWRAGAGVYVAQGNGHFVSAANQDLQPREIFTFVTFPISLGAIYRMQIWNKQLFVPYGEGGLTLFPFGEFRDDNKGPKFGGSAAAYFAGGVALNLTYFNYLNRIQLDREYGINAVYLTAEYRTLINLSPNYDFSSDLLNAGFLMEY